MRDKDFVRAGDIGAAVGIGPSTLSGHLKVLRQAGLVETRRRATEVQYRLQLSLLDEAIVALAELRPRRAESGAVPETTGSVVPRTANQEGTP